MLYNVGKMTLNMGISQSTVPLVVVCVECGVVIIIRIV